MYLINLPKSMSLEYVPKLSKTIKQNEKEVTKQTAAATNHTGIGGFVGLYN